MRPHSGVSFVDSHGNKVIARCVSKLARTLTTALQRVNESVLMFMSVTIITYFQQHHSHEPVDHVLQIQRKKRNFKGIYPFWKI